MEKPHTVNPPLMVPLKVSGFKQLRTLHGGSNTNITEL
jgi:hypothetical protein